MRVNQSTVNTPQGSETAATKQTGRGAPAQGKRVEQRAAPEAPSVDRSGVNTEISAKSRDFSRAKSIASNSPDVREDRVADLKKRIADGSYSVNPDAVADRMVDEHLRMSGIG